MRANPKEEVQAVAQRLYEAMVIFNPNLGDDRVTASAQRLAEQIAARGGQVEHVDTWGRRRMMYPIKHSRDGYYVVYTFRCEPQAVRDLEAAWRIQEEVLRHLVVRRDES
jgi:small subunit ribosomal protein S6